MNEVIKAVDLTKIYNKEDKKKKEKISVNLNQVLNGVSLEVYHGDFISIMGKSGCGKTTMLRLIAGFEKPTSGEIYIGDRPVSGKDNFVSPEKREIGMVFQSYAVWPHMNVYDNIAYPLKIKKTSKKEIDERVNQALKTVHLEQYKDRFSSELSGGQQQRVAIARALVSEAPIILADEPTGNLDPETATNIVGILKRASQDGTAVIMSTHNIHLLNQFPGKVFRCRDGEFKLVTDNDETKDLDENDKSSDTRIVPLDFVDDEEVNAE